MITIEQLIKKIKLYNIKSDEALIRKAFEFANTAHKGQKRLNGDDYIQHPLRTAIILTGMKLSDTLIIAGLLHDVPEDTSYTLKDIQKEFGNDVSELVSGITKLGKIKYRGIERYLENLRKMFIAMAADIRVVLIKCADRIHNLETLEYLPKEKQERIAKESLEIFAQIAHRLGITHLQNQIEMKAFPFAYPREYKWVKDLIQPEYQMLKKRQLAKIINRLPIILNSHDIEYIKIYGRTKELYSLYKKLLRKGRDINQIYDYIALRVIVKNIEDCYKLLGVIHQTWQPVVGRIKDYIAQAKPNGYQSLHTTIFDDEHNIIEIQIRTQEMNETAEYGIAAHWLYKSENGKLNETDIAWLKELTKWQKNFAKDEKYLEHLKLDVFQSRIYVFTPKGDVVELPEEATPVDFAYHLHTKLGDSCSKSLVNGQLSPLSTKLKNGDMVEIITNPHRQEPKPEWLNFVKTRVAKNKIKTRIKQKYKSKLKT